MIDFLRLVAMIIGIFFMSAFGLLAVTWVVAVLVMFAVSSISDLLGLSKTLVEAASIVHARRKSKREQP